MYICIFLKMLRIENHHWNLFRNPQGKFKKSHKYSSEIEVSISIIFDFMKCHIVELDRQTLIFFLYCKTDIERIHQFHYHQISVPVTGILLSPWNGLQKKTKYLETATITFKRIFLDHSLNTNRCRKAV